MTKPKKKTKFDRMLVKLDEKKEPPLLFNFQSDRISLWAFRLAIFNCLLLVILLSAAGITQGLIRRQDARLSEISVAVEVVRHEQADSNNKLMHQVRGARLDMALLNDDWRESTEHTQQMIRDLEASARIRVDALQMEFGK